MSSMLYAIGLQTRNSNVLCILCKKKKTNVTTVRAMLKHVYRRERPFLSGRNYSTSVSTGWPRHRENREFGSYFFQTGKTQGILL